MATVRPAVANQAGDMAATEWDDALLFEVAVDPFQTIAAAGKEDGRAAGRRDGYLEGVGIGRSKGWEIGLELGYVHGVARGILDGYEKKNGGIGEQEHGASSAVDPSPQSSRQRTSHRLERCLTLARDLVTLVEEFPDPDTLLSQNRGERDEVSSNDGASNDGAKGESCDAPALTSDGCCSADDQACSEEPSNGGCCGNSSSVVGPDCNGIHEAMDGLALLQNDDKTQKTKPTVLLDVTASMERIRSKFKLLCVLLKTNQSYDLKRVLGVGKESTATVGDEIDGTGTHQLIVGKDTLLKSDQRENRDDPSPGEDRSGNDVSGMESNAVENDW